MELTATGQGDVLIVRDHQRTCLPHSSCRRQRESDGQLLIDSATNCTLTLTLLCSLRAVVSPGRVIT